MNSVLRMTIGSITRPLSMPRTAPTFFAPGPGPDKLVDRQGRVSGKPGPGARRMNCGGSTLVVANKSARGQNPPAGPSAGTRPSAMTTISRSGQRKKSMSWVMVGRCAARPSSVSMIRPMRGHAAGIPDPSSARQKMTTGVRIAPAPTPASPACVAGHHQVVKGWVLDSPPVRLAPGRGKWRRVRRGCSPAGRGKTDLIADRLFDDLVVGILENKTDAAAIWATLCSRCPSRRWSPGHGWASTGHSGA